MHRLGKNFRSRRQCALRASRRRTRRLHDRASRNVLGGPRHRPPSEKLNLAAIGVGGQGGYDLQNLASENIVLCDVDDERAADTFKKFRTRSCKDFRVMLEKERGIDAVLVGLPDHVHAIAALTAIRAGKHVYVEKPLTYCVQEARTLR